MRGGGQPVVPLDAAGADRQYARELADELTPERIFDRSWALTLLGRVLDNLGREYDEAGKASTFAALRDQLAGEIEVFSYADVAARLGTTDGTARIAASRLRRRYCELLRKEIAATLADSEQVDDEIRDLFAALGVG